MIVLVTEAPTARSGTLQVTVWAPFDPQSEETNDVPVGGVSTIEMPFAVLPVDAVLVLVTVSV